MNAIEEKCKLKGVRLTDQRKIIAQSYVRLLKKNMVQKIILMWMNYIKELVKLIVKLVSQQFIEL